jgi:glutathione S-transferase
MPPQPKLALYHFPSCPYCQKVQRAVRELDLSIEQVNISERSGARQELLEAVGRARVPVLRIGDREDLRWMPESSCIVDYLYTLGGRRDLLWRSRISSALMMAAVLIAAAGLIGLGPARVLIVVGVAALVLSIAVGRVSLPGHRSVNGSGET